ncbi:MAG: hypothetical protein RMK89_10490 [Armatimonadota bacterium]|nr:hypothetical protein [Armatimonadota bacterium]MDW8143877.1 hypothetical protein [Armatimonadota bacterium]
MRWLCRLLLALCSVAWSQERQVVPLRYELWWDERVTYKFGPEQTSPGDVKLPSLKNPFFFSHKFGDTKRIFAVAEQNGEFILFADTNGNNDLTDERPFSSRQRGYMRAFGPIPMRIQINGRTLIRYIGAEVIPQPNGEVSFHLLAASRWKGTVNWDGRTLPVTIIDANADGLVNERDSLVLGDETQRRRLPVSGRLGIDGRFFRFHVPPTGEHLVFEAVQLKSAILKFQGEEVSLTLEGDDGQWILEGRNGQVVAPVGEFRLMNVTLFRKDEQGRKWQFSAYAFGPAAPKLLIPEAGTNLNFEPLKVSLVWNRKGEEIEFSLDIKTENGMSLSDLRFDGFRRPPEPKLRLVAPNGKVIAEPQFHYG